jgi:hypothetical protein
MNDAAQTRRCNGPRCANHSLFRPSPAGRPNLKISNQESLRRVRADDSARRYNEHFHLIQTKERIGAGSNRENNAWLSDRVRDDSARRNIDQPNHRPNLKISNRESLRLEIAVTQTKERRVRADDSARGNIDTSSNREKEAWFFGPSRGGCFSPPAFRPRFHRGVRWARPSPTKAKPPTQIRGGKKTNSRSLILVAIKPEADRLFCAT